MLAAFAFLLDFHQNWSIVECSHNMEHATMTDNENIHDIPACNFTTLEEAIEKLNRRATRLGCQPIVLRVIRRFEVEKKSPRTRLTYKQARMEIEVIGESPKLEGWTLLAVVEMLDNGENLVRTVPGQTVPEAYRQTDTHCDHCNSIRRRKEVFILGHEDGRTAQVGRQCIADFLGHVSASSLAARAEFNLSADQLVRDAEDEGWGFANSGDWTRDITEFLGTVAICIRRCGWKSRKMLEEQGRYDEQTTAALAWNILIHFDRDKYVREFVEKNNIYAEERDTTLAQEALDWARAFPTTGVSDYEYNLGVACRQETVTYKTIGIVGSAVSAYLRHLERVEELNLRKKRDLERKHLGNVGERLGFAQCEIRALKYFESQYGVKTLVRFEDPDGNVLIWWASKELDNWEVGDKVDITGTVDKHDDYNGCPQTVLKRVAEGLPKPKKARKSKKSAEHPAEQPAEHPAEEPVLTSEVSF